MRQAGTDDPAPVWPEVWVDARGYSAHLLPDGQVSVSDRAGVWAGVGRWSGTTIEDCPAVLGGSQNEADEIYEALDAALAAALDAHGRAR